MKKFVIGAAVGFFTMPLVGSLLLFAAYGVSPFYIFDRTFIADPPPGDHRLASYGNESDGFLDTKSSFITRPGVYAHQGGITIFRLDPVIDLADSADFETCFTVTDLETGIFANALGLKVFLTADEQETLKASLEVNDLNMFIIEDGNQVTQFHTKRDDEPKNAYIEKIENRPGDADLTFVAREEHVLMLMGFAKSLTPGRRPPACQGGDDLHTIDHWDLLMERYFPN